MHLALGNWNIQLILLTFSREELRKILCEVSFEVEELEFLCALTDVYQCPLSSVLLAPNCQGGKP